MAKLVPNDPVTAKNFGQSVGLSRNRLISGAMRASGTSPVTGAAYVFERGDDAMWRQHTRVFAHDGSNSDVFGWSTAIVDDLVTVGAPGDDEHGQSSGSAYVYAHTAESGWREIAKLAAPDGVAYSGMGTALGLATDAVIVGAWEHDLAGVNSGAAYAFAISGDLDGDGVMDVCECLGDLFPDRTVNEIDLAIMLYYWNQGPGGDIDRDGDTDEADLGLLLASWGTFCP
ncbi:MAG: FG-GAP repeat protein [Phycisphaerae bacterium]